MKKCPNCSREILESAVKCEHCGENVKKVSNESGSLMKVYGNNKKYESFRPSSFKFTIIGIILILISSLVSFMYLNSQIKKLKISDESRILQKIISPEEVEVRKAFDESMNFRLVGNCDSFADSASKSDEKSREEWGERCRREKVGETVAISNIEINRLSIKDDKAFIQANLTRAIDLGENVTYTGTYELKLEDGKWKLLSPKD